MFYLVEGDPRQQEPLADPGAHAGLQVRGHLGHQGVEGTRVAREEAQGYTHIYIYICICIYLHICI